MILLLLCLWGEEDAACRGARPLEGLCGLSMILAQGDVEAMHLAWNGTVFQAVAQGGYAPKVNTSVHPGLQKTRAF